MEDKELLEGIIRKIGEQDLKEWTKEKGGPIGLTEVAYVTKIGGFQVCLVGIPSQSYGFLRVNKGGEVAFGAEGENLYKTYSSIHQKVQILEDQQRQKELAERAEARAKELLDEELRETFLK